MRSGRLRKPVTFQVQEETKNSRGEIVGTWASLADRRVSIEPIMGREFWQQSGEHADITTRIRVRYDATMAQLRPKDRAVDFGSSPAIVYDIQAIMNVQERGRELVLMCIRSG